jgi:hypothetical protein
MTCARCARCNLTHMVATTENFVGNLIALTDIAYNNLFAFGNHYAIDGASIVRCAGTAPAESFDLKSIYTICKFDESGGTRKEFRSEISKDSKCVDINAKSINNLGQAVNLIWLIELSFIADDVIDAIAHREMFNHKFMDIEFRFYFNRI